MKRTDWPGVRAANMAIEFHVVIPARYGSTRLPGKPLRLLGERLLVEHVYHAAMTSGAASVIIATDDTRVVEACEARGMTVCMTDVNHCSGTDRCAEVATALGWPADAIVVNVQGDEPLIAPGAIAAVARALADSGADIATLATPITQAEDFANPNLVKVVRAQDGSALYFSRAPIPHRRDTDTTSAPWLDALHHIGLYAYTVATLARVTALPPCVLERTEALEQLRALYYGLRIAVDVIASAPGPGVDTEADLHKVTAILVQRGAGS